MSGNYHYTPTIWPSLCTVILLLLLSVYAWRRRSMPGALPFAIGCLLTVSWSTGIAMEYAAVDLSTKIFWYKFQTAWQLPATTAIICFFLEYTWPGRWLTRRNLALLSIVPLLTLIFLLTDNFHHLAWSGFGLSLDGSVIPLHRPATWILIAYSYAWLPIILIILGWLFIHSPQHRWPVGLMVFGEITGRAAYLLHYAASTSWPQTMPVFTFPYLTYAIALFAFRILDPIPLARRTVIEQLRAGMLVLDPQGRIVSLNPSAEQILRLPAGHGRGQQIQDLLPDCPDVKSVDPAGTEIEINLGEGQNLRQYMLGISPLNDWRGLEVGRLLMLRDVSRQKHIQAQIVEQQRALAMLQEREQLARELHDSLGQVLAYISLQAQAISKHARDGRTALIEPQLARLAEVAQEAHKDIRESILNLKTSPAERWSFFADLRGHLASYQENYGIPVELVIPDELAEDLFETEAAVQLLRIIQEALTNTRKHGQASRVQVSFTCEEDHARIAVTDDGCGFDPDRVMEDRERHFGLVFMRERINRIGGSLTIDAQPGTGTRVLLQVPIREKQEEAA